MTDTGSYQRNIGRYQAYACAMFTPFMLPVIVLFWQENGLDLFEIYLLQAIFALAIVLFEVPTGMLADRVGKRASLVLGGLFRTVGMVAYALGSSFESFLVGELLLALGLSLHSGAGSALLYDTLKALQREERFQKLEGRVRAIQMVAVAACTLLGGLVGHSSYRATVWLSVLGPLVSVVLSLGLVEVQSPRPAGSLRQGLVAYRDLIGQSLRFVGKHRLVRWQIAFLGVLTGSGMWLLWLYQPYMQECGLPVWTFGGAFTLFNLFAALMSHQADAVDRRFGRTGTVVLLVVLQVSPLVLMALVMGRLSFLFILGHQAVRGLAMPIVSARILRYTYADKRATVLSLSSMASRLFFAVSGPLIGYVGRSLPLSQSLLTQAVLLTLLLGALLVAYVRIPAKYFQVKAGVSAKQ